MFRKQTFLCLFLYLFLFFIDTLSNSNVLIGFNYDLGFTCNTFGRWTQNALNQTQKLIAAAEALKANENCVGIESLLSGLHSSLDELETLDNDDEDSQQEQLEKQKSSTNGLLNKLDTSNQIPPNFLDFVSSLYFDSAISNVANVTTNLTEKNWKTPFKVKNKSSNLKKNIAYLVNKAMQLLPTLETCLVNAPNQFIALISSIVNLSSSVMDPDNSEGSNYFSSTIANFVTFIRNSRFAFVLKDLHQNELWTSITCALETTAYNYCQNKDNLKLLEWSLDQLSTGKTLPANDIDQTNPLAAYYLLIRNVPTITRWLLKVQFGVKPRWVTDGENKNMVWKTILAMVQTTNLLLGTFSESKYTIMRLQDDISRKSETYNLIQKLTKAIKNSTYQSGPNTWNFFTVSMPAKLLPMYFIGYDMKTMPPEVKPNKEGKFVMTVHEWILNMGEYRPMFDNHVELLNTIEKQLDRLNKRAENSAIQFFISRLIVDQPNLVAEAYVYNALNTSVIDSFDYIEKYLIRLIARINSSIYGSPQVATVVEQTIAKIRLIQRAFNQGFKAKGSISETDDRASKIIEIVYHNFNVLKQRESFITNRMATFVYYDYYLQIAEGTNFDQYERDLLIISNLEMLDRIFQANQTEPAINREDFQTAMMLNRRNLDAFENLFRDNFFQFLQLLDDEASRRPIWRRNLRVLRRFNNEVPKQIRYTPLAYLSQIGDYFFGNSYKYRFTFNNPFNPTYLRGDNDHHSFLNTKNRICTQLLAFQKPSIFNEFCYNSVVVSPFNRDATRKDLNYLNVRFRDFLADASPKKTKSHDDRICAYRDYLRRNNVYWLTLQHAEIKKKRLGLINKTSP